MSDEDTMCGYGNDHVFATPASNICKCGLVKVFTEAMGVPVCPPVVMASGVSPINALKILWNRFR